MENRTISFEDLPQATSALQGEVKALRSAVEQLVVEIKSSKGKETVEDMIGVDEACRLLGLKKPTVYHKAQKREIKSYKPEAQRGSCSNALNFMSGWRAKAAVKNRLPMWKQFSPLCRKVFVTNRVQSNKRRLVWKTKSNTCT